MSAQPVQYAVQRPKGTKWETLALVDDAALAQREYRAAVSRMGHLTFVRLIQVQFKTSDVLADYDWRLIELHDPLNRKDRPNLKPVAASRRGGTKWQPGAKDNPIRRRRPGERVPIPLRMYVLAFILGGLLVTVWHFGFRP